MHDDASNAAILSRHYRYHQNNESDYGAIYSKLKFDDTLRYGIIGNYDFAMIQLST